MESKNTEEIICTNCGRPNLPEAVKCWYCQIPLITEEDENPGSSDHTEPETQQPLNSDHHTETQEGNEDIPDWLKRIREMKKEDQAKEEEKDQWQQQDLFTKGDKPAEAAPKTKRKPEKPADKNQLPAPKEKKAAPQSKPVINKDAGPQEEKSKPSTTAKNEEPELDNPPEDLPDGFVKFDSKNS